MKRVVLLISMLAMGVTLSAQQNQHSNYFGLEIGGGHNGLTYKADNGSYYLGWGFQGGLRYAHFFGSHFGMGLGVQAARTFTLDKVPQHKMFSYLNIPVELYWRAPLCNTWSFLFGLGGSMDMPLGGEKAMTEKIGASILADLGFNYQLCNNWGLYMGIYGSYSFTEMYETDVQVPDLRLYNVGLKLGVNVGWNCHSGAKDSKSGAGSDVVAYDNNADNNANGNNYDNNNYDNNNYGNNNDEEEAAAREARCNARRMNNPDMAQANADIDGDIASAEQMAEASSNAAAKEAVEDAKAKAADAKNAYKNGQYCKAYDLFIEAYGDIADSYADDAATYAENANSSEAQKAATDADIYADAAHKDGLDCAMAASRNARINCEIARDVENGQRKDAVYSDPSYADYLAGEALTMAEDANSKAAKTDAKDASGKAYRGNLADSYAASAKSFAGSAKAYADKGNNPDAKAAAEDAQRYAAEAAEAARMGDVAGAYRAARAAQQAAERARRLVNGDEAKPATSKPAASQQPADRGQIQKYIDQINATIHYDFGSTEPKFDNKSDLAIRALCAAMKADSRVKVLITGHTDNVGSAESNMSYGKKRAEALKKLMVNQGAPASSIATASRGQEEPVVDNDTDEHRHQNRRAVITLR